MHIHTYHCYINFFFQIPCSLKIRSVLRELTTFRDAAGNSNFRCAAHAFFWAPCNKQTNFGDYTAAVMVTTHEEIKIFQIFTLYLYV